MAAGLQKVTTYGDETIIGAENLLLTFTKIGRNIFPQALETVLDMSTALGQDLKSSAIQVGKALQDPILGVTALRRVGVNFNEQQAEQIKLLVESGKMFEAQKFILQELSTEFGGSARASLDTYQGSTESLKNTVGDLKEEFGQTITESETFKEGIQDLNEIIRAVIEGGYIDRFSVTLEKFYKIARWLPAFGPLISSFETLDEWAERELERNKIAAVIEEGLLEVKRQLVDGIKDETEAIDPLCKELGVSADYFSKNAMAARLYQIQLLALKLEMDQWKLPKLIKSPQELMEDMGFTDFDEVFKSEWEAFEASYDENQQSWLDKSLANLGIYGAQAKGLADDRTEHEISMFEKIGEASMIALGQSKAGAIAQATMSTYAGAAKTIEMLGMPWAIPFVALAILTGLKQVSDIVATPLPSADTGAYLTRDMAIQAHRGEVISPVPIMRETFRETIREAGTGPQRIIINIYQTENSAKTYQKIVKNVNKAGQIGDLVIPVKVLAR